MTKSEYEKYRKAKQEARRWKRKYLEAKPKPGRWIENDKGAIICSYCNTWFPKERKEFMLNCPYCKAKMEG